MQSNSVECHYAAFNQLYEDFMLKMIDFFPLRKQLRFYFELFNQIKQTDIKLPAAIFLKSTAEHSLYVFNKDEQYFINRARFQMDIENKTKAVLEQAIVNDWHLMTAEHKEVVWFYMHQMLLVVANIEDNSLPSDEKKNTMEDMVKRALVRDGIVTLT